MATRKRAAEDAEENELGRRNIAQSYLNSLPQGR
jgi:hypothetical protein